MVALSMQSCAIALNRRLLPWLAAAWILLPHASQAAEPVIMPLRAGGIYAGGEEAGWQIAAAADTAQWRFTLRRDGREIRSGVVHAAEDARIAVPASTPGMLTLEIMGGSATDPVRLAGAAADPRRIAPATPLPRDFDRFWKQQIEQADRVPMTPRLESGTSDRPGVDYYTLRLRHGDGGTIHAQMAKPSGPGRHPALVIFQWAGRPYPLQKSWVTERAAEGWLVLNVQPHDVLPTEPQAYYDALPESQKEYAQIGRDDRTRSYFLRMYLGDYRAVDYLASRPDWDGRQMVVMGTSMGGQQAVCTAALHPRVTALIAHMPAGADLLSPLKGRAAGYPNWPAQDAAVQRTAPYFDAMNCARRVTAPSLVSMGFLDTVTPPGGIWALYNQLRGPKEAVPLPEAAHNHQSTAAQQLAYTKRAAEWLAMLRAGQDPAAPARVAQPRLDANSAAAHQDLLAKRGKGRIDVYFLGDSITRRWGAAEPKYASFLAHWQQSFHGWNAANFGWGGDRTQNILWRLEHGELTGVDPRVIVLMAGTNNVGARLPAGDDEALAADIAGGVEAILRRCRELAPRARIVLMAITPRNDNMAFMPVITRTNAKLARMADGKRIRFVDLAPRMTDAQGHLLPGVTEPDQLHLALPGYQIWADALRPVLTEMLGPPAPTDQAPPPTGDPSAMRGG